MTTHPPFRWDRLTVAVAWAFCLLIPAISVNLVLAELIDEFDIGGTIAALHSAGFGVGLLLWGSTGAAVVGRIGRRRGLQGAAALIMAGVVLFATGPVWPLTLVGALVAGGGAALFVVVLPGVVSDHHGPHRARAYAAVNAPPALTGMALGVAVGAALTIGWSWRPVFVVVTAVLAVVFVTSLRGVQLPDASSPTTARLGFLRHPEVTGPLRHLVVAILAEASIGVWCVAYLRDVGGAGKGAAPLLSVVFPLFMVLSRLQVHRLELRLGRRLVSMSFIATAIGTVLLVVLPWLAARVAALAWLGATAGLLYPLSVDEVYRRGEHAVDSVTLGAASAMAHGLAVSVGPVALGAASDLVGLRWAMLIVPVVALIGAWSRR